jgi:gamma-carbonic anhydrase
MATSSTSVPLIEGPHPDARALDAAIAAQRRLYPRASIDRYLDKLPSFGDRVLVAPSAALIGDVRLGDDVSIWVQDGSVIHVGDFSPCTIGSDTVVGHRVVLHGCRVEDGCIVGMQATILDDAVIGEGSLVGAGALVTQKTVIPPRSLVLGAPARVIRTLTQADETHHREMAAKYARLKENYLRDALRGG